MPTRPSRRSFLQSASIAATAGFWVAGRGSFGADSKSPNEKLNMAVIGCGGQGSGHVRTAAGQTLVAMCDVDQVRAAENFEKYASVEKFDDFRVMFDKRHKDIDAVFVATPDHLHAPIAVMAMKLGKHVYCEKPLAHTPYEARVMARVASEMKVATQLGNQGHSSKGSAQIVEAIRAGVVGRVKEVHGWCPKNFAATTRPSETTPVPATLNWDLWLGPAPERPYNKAYLPFNWRAWWDFGTGGIGDMAVHILDPAFWALDLDAPKSVQTEGGPSSSEAPEGFAKDLTVHYEFADRGEALHQKAVKVFWHHGGHIVQKRPIPGITFPSEVFLAPGEKAEKGARGGKKEVPGEGLAFVGEKGVMICDRGQGIIALTPLDAFSTYKHPDVPGRAGGHSGDFINGCKTGTLPGSHFGYGARLTEMLLLGNIAWKVGKKLEWDGANMRATNAPEAQQFLQKAYRKGWVL